MNAKSTIRKILFITIWLGIGGGMVTLLLAAITSQNKGKCNDYVIKIESSANQLFIDKKDIQQILEKVNGGKIKGKSVASFNLQQIEEELKKNSWVSEAETYFDNQDVLHVNITEKEPVARIFTEAGKSFYIDDSGKSMPLSEKYSARLPVFTGYPDIKKMNAKDSVLLNDVTVTAKFILHDPFWMSQVSEININDERTFEITPLVGNHIIRIGNGENVERKFHRLFIFYQQVLSKTGFEKYKSIDVRFEGQVVASAQNGNIKIDPKQYKKYVEKLIKESNEEPDETIIKAVEKSNKYELRADSVTAPDPELGELEKNKQLADKRAEQEKKTDARRVTEQTKPVVKDNKSNDKKAIEEKRIPKAVMPPKKNPDEEENGGYN
ncbi:MAG TPA: cell division protein FtsQ/DivIB [Chitinophagaceae bacterium]|nr:cell division protein FtsQ/DivIB [Chitinophagaceae bacterium]